MATSWPRKSKSNVLYSSKNNFWSIGGYHVALKRLEIGKELCHDLQCMLDERAAIEEKYAAKLKSWRNQWYTKIQSNGEYASSRQVWLEALKEGQMTSRIHSNYQVKIGETSARIHSWRKSVYQKSGTLNPSYKIIDQIKDGFKAAEKHHKKTMDSLKGLWKTYHDVEAEFQKTKEKYKAAVSKNEQDGVAKYEKRANDVVERGEALIKEMHQVMKLLNRGKEKYMKDMKDQYQITDIEEMKRKEFFKLQLVDYLQHFQNQRGGGRNNMLKTIEDIYNPKTDVMDWYLQHGPGQNIKDVWPVIPESCPFTLSDNAMPVRVKSSISEYYAKRTYTDENKPMQNVVSEASVVKPVQQNEPSAPQVEQAENAHDESFVDDFSSDENLDHAYENVLPVVEGDNQLSATSENVNAEAVHNGPPTSALKPVEDYQLYEVLEDYTARGLEELSLDKGEKLVMIYKYSDELNYFEKQQDRSIQGYVPMTTLKMIEHCKKEF